MSRLDDVPALVWGVALILLGLALLAVSARAFAAYQQPSSSPTMERLIYDGVAAPPSPTPPPL